MLLFSLKIRVLIAILYLLSNASSCNLVIIILSGDQIDSTMPRAMNVAKKAPRTSRKALAKSPVVGDAPKAKKPRASRSKAPSPAAVPMTGTFHETFYNVNEMDMEGERSDIKIIGGFPWRLWMCRYGGGDHQLFIECCQSEETPVWHADFEAKITFEDAGYGCNFIERKEETVSQARWLVRAEQLDRYMDKNFGIEMDPIDSDEEEEGAPTVDYVSVEVVITVKEAKGDRFRPKPTIDIFTPNEETYDCALEIGDKKIQVNKQYLAFHSSFFKDLFKKGDEQNEVKVDGVTPEDFALLLGYLYRTEDTITVANWETLAKMSLQFQIQELKDSLEYWLMDHYEVQIWSAAKKLLVAGKYGMESYQEVTLAEIRSDYELKKVKESEEWKEYKKEMKERIEAKEEEMKKEKEKK